MTTSICCAPFDPGNTKEAFAASRLPGLGIEAAATSSPLPNGWPDRKSETQDVLLSTATCTAKDPMATADRNSGTPVLGFTTSHIFALFMMCLLSAQPWRGHSHKQMRHQRNRAKNARAVDQVAVHLFG